MQFSPEIERWRKYLSYDPTRWLLETDDPSILLRYQLDIAHRPEDAPGVVETRERVLYSDTVQAIFAAQNEMGFWGDAELLSEPRYTATIWNLALLAELGIPRTGRRARNACEFILQNFVGDNGTVEALNAVETGFLLRALGYFNLSGDARVVEVARNLVSQVDSFEARVSALWGWQEIVEDAEIARASEETLEIVLNQCADAEPTYTFPQFDPRDALFVLRVLSAYNRVNDARAAPLVDALVAKQNDRAQWTLERPPSGSFVVELEPIGEPSRWLTLIAATVIARLVNSPRPLGEG